ncbi:MAG: putative ABC transporter permease [Berryella intestinalis]|uniref:putative ABC transporter permease n=1 Tax=Berryella intestinalis TaxID=1531429 RepID=UPI002A74D9BA|nr:putative ABC transporter permease [Berryella intestinalis]MDY3128415.1 putative ABC transporter permease [Berryella intestinalis]
MESSVSKGEDMGFLRVLGVYWAVFVAATIFLLGFAAKDQVAILNAENAIFLIKVVFNAIALWLFIGRKRALVIWGVVGGIASMAACSALISTEGVLGTYSAYGRQVYFAIIVFYFACAKKPRAILTQPLSLQMPPIDENPVFRLKSWRCWRNLVMYVCAFSIVGHWIEIGWGMLIRWGVVAGAYDPTSQIWHDLLFPFMVYGIGAAACVLVLHPVKRFLEERLGSLALALALSFAASALFCTGIELVEGLLLNQPLVDGSLPLWDYRNIPMNFMGQVCLQNSIAFGLASTLFTWIVYPVSEKALAKLPEDAANALFVLVVTIFLMLFFLYCVDWGSLV